MNRNRLGIVLVVDDNQKLQGTITDGDIRRALLSKTDLNISVEELIEGEVGMRNARPIAAPVDQSSEKNIEIFRKYRISHIPLLDESDRVVGLLSASDLLPAKACSVQAVIMAGGKGTRLRPLTEDLPKPMLPVGGRPLLELTIQRLANAGIKRVNITTHYKPEKIQDHFGDGSAFGVELNYVSEDRPLGTAGGLNFVQLSDEPLLVINGDVLTGIDVGSMLAFHQDHDVDLTVAVRQYDVQVPYGVVECDGPAVKAITEKPVLKFFVNAGIYMLQPEVLQFVPDQTSSDMTQLIQRLLDSGRKVASFPLREYWLDIGQVADYEQAQEDVEKGKVFE